MIKLDGASALVVGGGRGLGRVTALAFAKEGADVAVEATPNAVKQALLQPETVADIMVTIVRHPDLRLSEVIVPEIRLPYTTPYKNG